MSSVGALDLFRIGVGPSSSHTVGPMRAARRFTVDAAEPLSRAVRVRVELFGSLGATGVGHGTIPAVLAGLAGRAPETVDPDLLATIVADVSAAGHLRLAGSPDGSSDPVVGTSVVETSVAGTSVAGTSSAGASVVEMSVVDDVVLVPDETLPAHPNGMRFHALDAMGDVIVTCEYYSVGGGFVATASEMTAPLSDAADVPADRVVPHPFHDATSLVERCRTHRLSLAELALANESARHPGLDVEAALDEVWTAMRSCVARGQAAEGVLPGGLGVRRRASAMHARLSAAGPADGLDPLAAPDWVNLWALAVNEENAAGGRVVTAPTNGAAGIVPAVLHHYWHFVPGADTAGVVEFLLVAGVVGALFKMNASISGAEVGCQGEVGSACAMAAAGLAHVMGASPEQVENAAEIALEHNLGLTCDPIGGLVQVPCIERNAMAANKAINASRLALHGDGTHLVSLDQAIETLRDTGRDMLEKYKETSRGGLAVTFDPTRRHVPVSVIEC